MQNYFDNEATTSTSTSPLPSSATTATSVYATMKPARSGKCLVTFSTYEDRQEALNRTTMMDDPTTYRAKGTKQSKFETMENHSEESRQEDGNNNNNINSNNTNSHIPKPPPMQLLSSSSLSQSSTNNHLKTQNLTQKSQMFNTQASALSSSLYSNDQHNGVALRSASSSSNGSLAGALGSETQYRNSNRSSATALATAPPSNNRQTLRLGTVTIGEYHHLSARKEPEKFDFIAPSTKRNESGDTTPTNETLQSELHSTLARSKLKKTNGSALEHQRNCPLHQSQQQQLPQTQSQRHHHHHHQQQHHHQHPPQQQQPQQYEYQNVNFNTFTVSEMAKKLQKTSINGGPANGGGAATTGNHHTSTAGGILKNGNRNNSNSSNSNKSTEKSIKFG